MQLEIQSLIKAKELVNFTPLSSWMKLIKILIKNILLQWILSKIKFALQFGMYHIFNYVKLIIHSHIMFHYSRREHATAKDGICGHSKPISSIYN
jgi:hypothetical protein